MNPIVVFLLIMSMAGLLDKLAGGRLGLMKPFEEGMAMIGELLVYIAGLYCICITLSQSFSQEIEQVTSSWFFDPSVIAGSLLASDLGGYPISVILAGDPLMASFSGVVLAGSLGTLTSFYLPVYLSSIRGKDSSRLVLGFICGIIVLPVTAIAGGLMYGIQLYTLIKNLIPVFLFCALLLFGLIRAENITVTALKWAGNVFRLFTFSAFALVTAGLFFPEIAVIDKSLTLEAFTMVCRMGIIISGSLVTVQILRKILNKQLEALSRLLGINQWSILGMLVGMPAGIAMLPLFPKMDTRGKVINGAFTVSSHYVLGGQMAFIANMEGSEGLAIFFFIKLAGGILAVALAYLVCRKRNI